MEQTDVATGSISSEQPAYSMARLKQQATEHGQRRNIQGRGKEMRTQEDIPTLQVVAVEDLILHEEVDPQRAQQLKERLRDDKVLKNPPVVTPLGGGNYVVLDGANRVAGLQALAVRDVVVQVVDYNEVTLSTWNHLVAGIDRQTMLQTITQIPEIEVQFSDLKTARELWTKRQILAYIVCLDSDVCLIDAPGDLEENSKALLRLANVYKGRATIYRVQTDDIKELARYYEGVTAVITYPPFRPADILELARNGAKLPTGITRHIIPRRALRINMPLDFLSSEMSLEEKNAWLHRWIRRKLQNKEVRFYEEPTFLFDE